MKTFVVFLLLITTFPITSAPCPFSAVHKNKAWHTYSKYEHWKVTLKLTLWYQSYALQIMATKSQ